MFARRRRETVVIEISSMIDVVFLLLIFFMVTTTFAEQQAVQIDLPSTEGERQPTESEALTLQVDAEGAIWLQGERVSLATLDDRLGGLLAGRADAERVVNVEGDAVADWDVMLAVLDSLRRSRASAVMARTEPRPSADAAP